MESVIEIFQRSNKEWREEWPFDPLLGFSKLANGEIKKRPEVGLNQNVFIEEYE